MQEAVNKGYISKDKKGIRLLREDIFLKNQNPYTSFPIIKNKKSTELIDIIVDWYRAVGKLLLAALII